MSKDKKTDHSMPAGEHETLQIEQVAQEEIDKIMSKYDRESAYRTLSDWRGTIIAAMCVLFSLLQLYSTWKVIPATHMRPMHVGIVMLLGFLLYPMRKGARKDTLPWWDVALGILSICLYLYPVVFFRKIVAQNGLELYELWIGGIAILLLLECCRRVVGLPIVVIASVFILVSYFGRAMPGFLGNRGFSPRLIIQHLFYTTEGVFGTPIGASSTFIFLFILFGSFLEKTGVGEFFIELSNAIAGHKRGGPAKVAVITSALEGTVSGSSVANTVGSGAGSWQW